MSKNRVIGHKGQIPWKLPPDLKRFKKITTDHPIVMGRKTFESIGKPLPRRVNIVASKSKNFIASGAVVTHNLGLLLKRYFKNTSNTLFVIGGEEIYKHALPYADSMILTLIENEFPGDTFFPEWNNDAWEINQESEVKTYKKIKYRYQTLIKVT